MFDLSGVEGAAAESGAAVGAAAAESGAGGRRSADTVAGHADAARGTTRVSRQHAHGHDGTTINRNLSPFRVVISFCK